MTRSALLTDVARALYGHVVAVRRYERVAEFERLDERAREVYFGMAQAALLAVANYQPVFGLRVGPPKLSGLDRMRKALARWWKRHIPDWGPTERIDGR